MANEQVYSYQGTVTADNEEPCTDFDCYANNDRLITKHEIHNAEHTPHYLYFLHV